MYRCSMPSVVTDARSVLLKALAAVFTASAVLVPAAVDAQVQRAFPREALRGRLLVVQPPEAELNGHAQRLAPGSRIRDQNNMLTMSGALGNHVYIVNYTLDTLGQLRDVWILTDEERAKRPWPTTMQQVADWNFNVQTQTWSRP